jgi:hypothetical protein
MELDIALALALALALNLVDKFMYSQHQHCFMVIISYS